MKVGDKIRIVNMCGEPQYTGREGVVTGIATDPWGDTYAMGTWGGCSLYLSQDTYEIIN